MSIFTSLFDLIISCLNLAVESHTISHGNQESSTSASSGVSQLPSSVILEIFLKLPINSIIRCKCVCKSWNTLLSDPYFTSTYRLNTPFTSIVCSEHRTITNPLDHESFYIVEIGRNGDIVRTPFIPEMPNSRSNGITGVMGSCNGLLCLVKSPQLESESHGHYVYNRDSIYNNQTVCVVNPLMGECISLPDVKRAEYISDVIYGFGSTAVNNQYKVIRLVIRYVFPSTVDQKIVVSGEILTLGIDDRWRCFEDPSIPCYTFPCGIALNGFVHWIGDNRRYGVIYAFDVGEERGHCIPLPPGLGAAPGNIILAVWDGHLCLTDNGSDSELDVSQLDVCVWVMKRYGSAESWTRDVILRSRIPSDLRSFPLNPITTLRNGDLLMSPPNSQSLISFDSKTKRCRKLGVSHVEGTVSFLNWYIPSFTSLSSVYNRNQWS
ncbi:hypothetical protein C2S51_005758 [Perilla frutescens var. frutescens]|nr:hypothetical protein C2S51_005758 [Perilla frutescens var. frutescens]